MSDSVAIVSGGMDSAVMLKLLYDRGYRPHVLSFDYGQRHSKELLFARRQAQKLSLIHDIVDLTGITHLIDNSALTSMPRSDADELGAIEVPEGHYAEDNMKLTVVPNRNMIMLSIAAGVAVNDQAEVIGVGVHAGDHFVYPDCRPEFIMLAERTIQLANQGFGKFGAEVIFAPFLHMSKADIAQMGKDHGVDFSNTWSCYKGGEKHCGRCGTCVERAEAFAEAKIHDPTEYADPQYWMTVTRAR